MKIKTETIIRTIVLALALFNQVLSIFGVNILPITDEQIADAVSVIFTIASAVWAWWKNNSFTPEALKADEVLIELKNKTK